MHLPSLLTTITLLTTAIAGPSSPQSRSSGWTIREFTRECSDAGCFYNFFIDASSATPSQKCLIIDSVPQASSHSFYSVPCTNNVGGEDYRISWGWNYTNDFTVLTVVYVPQQLEAFFGYSHPNDSESYPDVGPNPVQSTGVPP